MVPPPEFSSSRPSPQRRKGAKKTTQRRTRTYSLKRRRIKLPRGHQKGLFASPSFAFPLRLCVFAVSELVRRFHRAAQHVAGAAVRAQGLAVVADRQEHARVRIP